MRTEQGSNPRDTMIDKIVFDHRYLKLPGGLNSGSDVRLIEVLKTKFEDLHPLFLCFDGSTFRDETYNFPKTGGALVLLLLYKTELFTTVRKHTPEKELEYKSAIGSWLKVEIENG